MILDKTLDKEEEERAFIERLGKFSAACINSRYNGTIYFGVTDSKDGTSSHGEVRGINKPYSSLFEYEEWIEKHFRKNPISLIKTARKENVAFSECISSLRDHINQVMVSIKKRGRGKTLDYGGTFFVPRNYQCIYFMLKTDKYIDFFVRGGVKPVAENQNSCLSFS